MTRLIGNSDPRVVAAIHEAAALEAAGESKAALSKLETVIEDVPEASAPRAYLAWFLSASGDHGEAVRHARRAVELSERSERASLVLFHVLMKAGLTEFATSELQRFLEIRDSEEHTALLNQLDARRGQGSTE